MEWIAAWSHKIKLDTILKIPQGGRINVELPLQVEAHLPLHPVHLPNCKHVLLQYVSSQIIFIASMKAEISNRWPEKPFAERKQAFKPSSK
jgi:hypothetical protein